MNYYERHLGDYMKKTAHLSMVEDGAYNRLIDRYYDTEQGIPADQAHRIVRARTKEEAAAVDVVLSEFFVLIDGVWHHDRCDKEIAKAQTRIKAARDNGNKGGRPNKNPAGIPEQTQEKPGGLLLGTPAQTQVKALQSPISNLQSPISNPIVSAARSDALLPLAGDDAARAASGGNGIKPEGEMAIALRDLGVQVSSMHPTLLGWIRDGFTTPQAVDATALARMRKPHPEPIPAAYLDKILRQPQTTPATRNVADALPPELRSNAV